MGGFQVAPNPSAPASSFANAASGAYSAGLQFATALRAAAAQQQQHNQQGLKDQFETELKLRKEGYTPAMTPGADSGTGHPGGGFATRDANPAATPANTITDHFGRKWVAPPPEAKDGATPQQAYTDLATALDRGGQPMQGNTIMAPGGAEQEQQAQASLMSAHVPVPDQSRVLTPPGGKQSVYMPTGDEKAASKLQQDLRAEKAKGADKMYTLPPAVVAQWEKKAKLPEGTLNGLQVPQAQIREVLTGLIDPKAPMPHITSNVNDHGDVTSIARDPVTGKELWNTIDKGAGKTKAAPAGGPQSADDAKSIAQAIMDGKQPPTLTGLYRQGSAVRGELARQGYNLTTATMDWQATQKHLATLNGAQQERLRQAVSFTSDSLDNIEKLYDEWQQYGRPSGIKVFNRASLKVAKNLPGKAGQVAQLLESQINDLTSELGTVYKGGNSSTDESLKLAAGNLSGEWGPETFKRAVGQIRTNLQIRRNSIQNSQAAGVSPGSQYAPQQQPTQPQQQGAPTQQGGAVQVKDPNGKVHTFPNQASADAFKKAAGIQ